MQLSRLADRLLEASVVGSFTSAGYEARRRLFDWDEDDVDLDGRRVLITGGTSGLGRAAATTMAAAGATVVITGRDAAKGAAARDEIEADAGAGDVRFMVADMADLGAVRALAADVDNEAGGLDVLVHNAGALLAERRMTVDGMETTFQVHLVGPALLTHELVPALRGSSDPRVIWVTSGGMYSEKLDAERVHMDHDGYDGTVAYARAKRAQVAMIGRWADELGRDGIVAQVMHPGWADTPGVEASLPTFRKVVGPFLRTPEQGADTIVWLAGAPRAATGTGGFWLDRAPRADHKVPWTRADDPDAEVDALWSLLADRAGLDELVPVA